MSDDHFVYIGNKPTMNYVLAAVTQMNGGRSLVIIKARGRSISKAVDVALIILDRFVQGSELQNIEITTEVLDDDDGNPKKISSIEISLIKP